MADVLRISLIGTLPSNETWSVNPVFAVEPPGASFDYTQLQAMAAAVDGVNPSITMRNMWNATTAISGCRVEARTFSGTLQGAADHARTTPLNGAGTSPHPFQTSLVTSLRTPVPGARGRGRLYWPATGISMDTTSLRLASATASSMLTEIKTLLRGIETALAPITGFTPKLSVWSRASNNAPNVNRILVGDVLDVQRRRRDAVHENYVSLSYPT